MDARGGTMIGFLDEREREFEARYKHDEELRFRVAMRRDKLLGLWAAEQFGFTDRDGAAYAKALMERDLEKTGDDEVVEKLLADFRAHGITLSAHRIRRRMSELFEEARRQVMADTAR